MLLSVALALLNTPQVPAVALPAQEVPHDAILGEAPVMRSAEPDDSVPLPQPAVWNSSAQGDTLVSAASGDPFFLGFVAGKYFPPAGERIDPLLASSAANSALDGRPARETYAFVMFGQRMTKARVELLESLGVRVLDFHPHYTVKVALAPELIDRVAALGFVRWIGSPRTWQKVHPNLNAEIANTQPGHTVDVFVDVFETDMGADSTSRPVGQVQHADPAGTIVDGSAATLPRTWMSNGWQQRRLEQLGLEITSFQGSINAFQAKLDPARLEELLALDFVQFVEHDGPNTPAHDESQALINADRTRVSYDGSTNLAALVGVIDSGCDIGHAALDPYVVGWDLTPENLGPFEDFYGHGSHVWGSILGNGDVEDSYQGAAPGMGWAPTGRVFAVKIYNSTGTSSGVDYGAALTAMHTSYNDGTNVTPRPMVVNNSYGLGATGATGTEAAARTIDAEVWDYNQLYVFAAGNEGPTVSSCRIQATAKNALTVGSVADYLTGGNDPGTVANSSSRGPCGDGRWKPNLCAPGTSIRSIDSETVTGYTNKSGTSMATPHVVGVASQLNDHYSFLRYNPACLSAVLMASAITKNNVLLSSPAGSASHFNDYGTGRVDAYKAHFGDSQQALYFWSTTLGSASSTYVEFPISSGATRVTIVVHYKEIEASSGASQALRNDFDTWIDASPFSAGNNSGEYVAQQSGVDNTEVRSLDNPLATDWRIKISPISTVPLDTVRVGICAVVTYGDTTPTPTFNVTSNDYYVQPGDDVTLTASYTNPNYIASGVYLDSTSSGDSLQASYGTLVDGSSTDWMTNVPLGRDVLVGDVLHGTSRSAHWTTHWNTEGAKSWSVNARSDNAVDATDSVTIYVDGTQPGVVTNLLSTSHTINVWSNDDTIDFDWNAATDNLSGIDGYGVNWGGSASIPPANSKDIEQSPTSYTTPAFGDSASWYFSVRSVDNCGNWDADYVAVGPYKIDTVVPNVPTNITSSTHTLGVQSCSTVVTMNWSAALDNAGGSGVAGYVATINQIPNWNPPAPANVIGGLTTYTLDIGSVPSARWFHVRTIDVAGNLGLTVHVGPIYANANSVILYCTAKINSLGCLPAIGTNGAQPSKSAGNFSVTCSNVISQKNGLCFWGRSSLAVPFQGGYLCVGAPTVRTANVSSGGSIAGNDCTGSYSFNFSTAYMTANSIDPGETIFAQFWMRDPASASTTGLSNAVQFTTCQ